MNTDWLVPDWPAPAQVRAVFTTRSGGVSAAPWDSMNLGNHVGDMPVHVQANRRRLRQAIDSRAIFLKQVHGVEAVTLDDTTPQGWQADACIARSPRQACCILVADCLPVLLAAEDGSAVAAAHAGWRGLAGQGGFGVLESVYTQFKPESPIGRAQEAIKTIAWLGPCIGPGAFEVGAEVMAAFVAVQREAEALFQPVAGMPGKFLADLPGLASLRLRALGVTDIYGNDGSPSWCTVSQPSRFFSHRRDAGVHGNGFNTTGRMAACIWLQ